MPRYMPRPHFTSSSSTAASSAPAKAWRSATERWGTTRYSAVTSSSSMVNGASRSASPDSALPSLVLNTGSASSHADIASEAAASSAPSVSTVQYTRKRPSCGRDEGTRQIWLKVASTLVRVISSDTIRPIAPATVSVVTLSTSSSSVPFTVLAALGTKLEKMYSVSWSRHSPNIGNADSTPSTTIASGTSAKIVV